MSKINYYIADRIITTFYEHKDDQPEFKMNEYALAEQEQQLEEHFQKEFMNTVVDEDTFREHAGRKWRQVLQLLYSFVEEYKYIAGRQHIRAIPISCQNKILTKIFGGQMNVSNMLKLATRVDLLKCVEEKYRFAAYNEDDNSCKKYIYNKHVQDLIIELAEKYKIEATSYKNFDNSDNLTLREERDRDNNTIVKTFVGADPAVKFSSKLRLKDRPDDQIMHDLYVNYPQLQHYQQLADELNERYYKNDKKRRIVFQPTITRSRGKRHYITKIGIRATNSLVSLKEHGDKKENEAKLWRKDWLNDHYNFSWQTFDVKSSIFRVNNFINSGEWLNNTIDFYELMYGCQFKDKESRERYKSIAMNLYFEEFVGMLYTHLTRKVKQLKLIFDKTIMRQQLQALQEAMISAIGDKHDSEIFLHESCIYLELQAELLKRGYDVTTVYDAVYVDKDNMKLSDQEFTQQCCDILKEKSREYRDKYIQQQLF